MEYAININTVLPIMTMPDENSPMASQLLFGEYCRVIGEKDNWYKIQNSIDNHIGWVEKETLEGLSKDEYEKLRNETIIRVSVPLADAFCKTDKTIYRLSMGSVVPYYKANNSEFVIGNKIYHIHSGMVVSLSQFDKKGIFNTATALLNTPYQKAGKTILGIDSIGFIQIVYAVNGCLLPGTISQLHRMGETIELLSDAESGDLMFFATDNSDKVHIGIYLGENQVAHVAKKVRINTLEQDKYLKTGYDKFAYKLVEIKRM